MSLGRIDGLVLIATRRHEAAAASLAAAPPNLNAKKARLETAGLSLQTLESVQRPWVAILITIDSSESRPKYRRGNLGGLMDAFHTVPAYDPSRRLARRRLSVRCCDNPLDFTRSPSMVEPLNRGARDAVCLA